MLIQILILMTTFILTKPIFSSIDKLFIDEIEAIDRAIVSSEKRLDNQRQIKNFLLELRHLEEVFLRKEDSKEAAARMVVLAEKTLRLIQEEHFESIFSEAYIEELRFYSSFTRKMHLA